MAFPRLFSVGLQGEIKRHGVRIASLVKLLLRAQTDAVDRKGWAKLNDAMGKMDRMQANLELHAERFGVKIKKKAGSNSAKRRRTVG